jgi:hypothetical protein
MNRTTIGFLVVAMIVVAIVAAVLLFSRFQSDSPFEGERSIDFGMQEMHGEPVVFTGTFTLRNTSGTAVHVLALRPNCGCVQAELPRRVIPAGQSLEIPFAMTLDRHGARTAYIDVLLADERVEQLRLDAAAREMYRITLAPSELQLDAGERQVVTVIVEVHGGENPPPQPLIDAPERVATSFLGWTELEGRQLGGVNSRRWRGEINVAMASHADASAEFPDAELIITLGEKDTAAVRVRGPAAP